MEKSTLTGLVMRLDGAVGPTRSGQWAGHRPQSPRRCWTMATLPGLKQASPTLLMACQRRVEKQTLRSQLIPPKREEGAGLGRYSLFC